MNDLIPQIRQWFEVPNSGSTTRKTISGAFGDTSLPGGGVRGATLKGSTIVVFGTYSYDSQELGSATDSLEQKYLEANYNADTTSAADGHQNFQVFYCPNSQELSATDEIIFSEPGVDYGGIFVAEITEVPADSFAGAVSSWQRGLTGSTNSNLNSGKLNLPAGKYVALISSVNCTNFGSAAPYAPSVGNYTQFLANWFKDPALNGDPDIGVIGTQVFTFDVATNFEGYFTTGQTATNDNYVTQAIVFKLLDAPVVAETPFRGTLTIGNSTANFTGTIPASVSVAGTNYFAGNVTIDNASGVFSGTLPAVSGSNPNPPPPVPPVTASPNDTVVKAGTTDLITDASGNKWGINTSGQVTINNEADTTTMNVTQLAYVNKVVWQENKDNLWWSKPSLTGGWTPTTGTATSPLPTTGTGSGGSPTPPTPPATGGTGLTAGLPVSGANVIYNGAFAGKELWPGDWSGGGVKENYNDTVDGLTCLTVTAVNAFPFWLPFAPLGGPNGQTPTLDPTPYSKLVIIMKPTGENADTLNIGCYTYKVVDGVVQGDVPCAQGVTMNKYETKMDQATGFITYEIPTSALQAVNPLYKIIVQDASTQMGQKFAVHYAAFVK